MRSRISLVVLLVSALSAGYAQTTAFPSGIFGTWKHVTNGELHNPDGTVSGTLSWNMLLRLEPAGATVKGSLLCHTVGRSQAGALTNDDHWRIQFELVPVSGYTAAYTMKLIGGTLEDLQGSFLAAPCEECTTWAGPVGTGQMIGNLGQPEAGKLSIQFLVITSPKHQILMADQLDSFEMAKSPTAFEDFLASDFKPITSTPSKSGVTAKKQGGRPAKSQDTKHAREVLQNADRAFESGDCKKAIPLYQSYIELVQTGKAGNWGVFKRRTAIADCYERMGKTNDAVEESKQIIAVETDNYALGIAYGRIGDTATALAKLRGVIDADPILPAEATGSDSAAPVRDPFARLAVILEKAGRTDEAALMRKESAIHAEARKAANPYVKRLDYGGAYRAEIKVYMKENRPLYAQAARGQLQDLQAAGGDTGPVPGVAATVLGVAAQGAADLAQTRAEGQATVAAAKEQAAQQRAQQEAANQEAARQAAAQQAAQQAAAQQAASQQTATRTSKSGGSPQPQYSTTCLRFQTLDKDVYTVENICPGPVDTKWCWLRKNGTWDCYMSLPKQPGVPEKLFIFQDWTTSVKQWSRTPGLDAPWPEP